MIGARGPCTRIQRIEGDICDESVLVQAASGCSVVFHLAGNMSFRKADFNEQHKVNVEGTRAVVNACLQTDVRRLVHTSTVNAIGLPKPDRAIGNENTPWRKDMERFGYAVTKRQGERLALQACGPKLEVVVVNPGTVFGAGDVNTNAGSYILAMARFPMLFYPRGGVSCTHIAALYRGRPGQRYILGGENLTYREIFSIIADVLGRQGPGRPYPGWPYPGSPYRVLQPWPSPSWQKRSGSAPNSHPMPPEPAISPSSSRAPKRSENWATGSCPFAVP